MPLKSNHAIWKGGPRISATADYVIPSWNCLSVIHKAILIKISNHFRPVCIHASGCSMGVERFYNEVAADLSGAAAPGLIVWLILPIDILLAWAVNRLFTRPLARLLRRT